jgi:protein ImuA
MPCVVNSSLIALRDRIRHIERPARHGVLPFGVAALDRALPGGGLALGAVHEILGAGGDEEDGAAGAGFAAGILARLGLGFSPTSPRPSPPPAPTLPSPASGGGLGRGPFPPLGAEREKNAIAIPLRPSGGRGGDPARQRWGGEVGSATGSVLWCLMRPDLYGPGLLPYGLDPARLVLVRAGRDDEILWAAEEGLRAGPASGLLAVVGEIGHLPMVAGRRLQLAAERSGITALILRRWRSAKEAAAERDRPTAALTRWRIAALPSADIANEPGIGRPRWRVALLRVRGGEPGIWDVEVADATGHVSLSAELADRPAAPARLRAEPPDSSEKRRRAG